MARLFLALALLMGCVGCENDQKEAGFIIEDFKGSPVFVNYWAQWCAPCREEIPALNQFQLRHPQSVHVVGVNFDREVGAKLAEQEHKLGITFPTLSVDPRIALGLDLPQGLPETLVLDQYGSLVTILKGPQTEAMLEDQLRQLTMTNK